MVIQIITDLCKFPSISFFYYIASGIRRWQNSLFNYFSHCFKFYSPPQIAGWSQNLTQKKRKTRFPCVSSTDSLDFDMFSIRKSTAALIKNNNNKNMRYMGKWPLWLCGVALVGYERKKKKKKNKTPYFAICSRLEYRRLYILPP